MYDKPCAASIVSKGDNTELWELDRETFRDILFDGAEAQLDEHKTFLTHVQLLSALNEEELTTIADALKVVNFSDGDAIINEGDDGESMYIMLEGSAKATKKSITDPATGSPKVKTWDSKFGNKCPQADELCSDAGVDGIRERRVVWRTQPDRCVDWIDKHTRSLPPYRPALRFAACIFERLLGCALSSRAVFVAADQKRSASIFATGTVQVLALPRSTFEAVLGKCQDILKRNQEMYDQINLSLMGASPRQSGRINGSMELLKEFQSLPGGDKCADCGVAGPNWASSNTGALICLPCSGVHRLIGPDYSKMLSVKLDAWGEDA
eukprot:SAG31_NODE_1576_length_7838_cov_5.738468_7_plen_324_part_00